LIHLDDKLLVVAPKVVDDPIGATTIGHSRQAKKCQQSCTFKPQEASENK
jgi:hypothetical protein